MAEPNVVVAILVIFGVAIIVASFYRCAQTGHHFSFGFLRKKGAQNQQGQQGQQGGAAQLENVSTEAVASSV
ncbi:hypothetical protein F5Y06DRAFT_16872 [Hypoxylon sp. FL0890]|nr:hypothetical protein F5Y06DRAFT_16872 [Hypoxylon sp. FL0890]